MKPWLSAAVFLVCVMGVGAAEEGWTDLFNGKDLEGWTPKVAGYALGENPGDLFRVADGKLVVSYDKFTEFKGEFGHLFYKTPFTAYRMKVEYRFVGEQTVGGPPWAYRNNGVMFHCQAPETMGKDQKFPDSIEAQLLGGGGVKKRNTGNLYTPGTYVLYKGEKLEKSADSGCPAIDGEAWVTFELEVTPEGKVTHYVNGQPVMSYEGLHKDSGEALTGGYIALQAESHGTEFRNVQIKELK